MTQAPPPPPPPSASGQAPRTAAPTSPRFFVIVGLVVPVIGGALLAWGLSIDGERSDLAAHGVAVTYHLATCDAGLKGGLTCRGSFTFNGVIYRESLSRVLDPSPDGSMIAALVDPAHPGTSVWTVAAVRGPNATVSGETVGGVAALVVGIAIVVFGLRRKRSSQRPSA